MQELGRGQNVVFGDITQNYEFFRFCRSISNQIISKAKGLSVHKNYSVFTCLVCGGILFLTLFL